MKAGFTGLGRIGAAMAARTSRPVTASRSITGPRPKRLTSLAEAPSAPVRCRGCRYGDVAVTILICAHREERRLRRYFPRDSDLIDGLLAAPAYKIRGKLICDEAYFGEPGSAATTGLIEGCEFGACRRRAHGGAPLLGRRLSRPAPQRHRPWRRRNGGRDWVVMALERARVCQRAFVKREC
jgi:hypothetical protein